MEGRTALVVFIVLKIEKYGQSPGGSEVDFIHGIGYFGESAGGDMGVDLGGFYTGMSEEFLDVAEIDALFQEVGGKAVPEGVGCGMLADA